MKRIEIALAFGALLWAVPAAAKDCRLPQPALGAPARQDEDCTPASKVVKPPVDERLKAEKGFIDLGNGTQVRISGRVRVDTEYKR